MLPVKFGNGLALEIRDIRTRALIYHTLGSAINANMPDPDWTNTISDISADKLVEFVDELWADVISNFKHQWVMLCSDIESLNNSDKFESKCAEVFGSPNPSIEPPDGAGRQRATISKDGKLHPRCWFIDTFSGQIFYVRFQFTLPIYLSSVFEGRMTPETTITADEGPDDHSGTNSPQSVTLYPTFQIKQVHRWCGAAPPSGNEQFIRQQLNVWFNTPSTEQCWFRSDETKDTVKFIVDIDASDAPDQIKLPMLTAVPVASSSEPNEDLVCVKWVDKFRIESSGLFRIYKTQYPFIYTLMPDDDERVEALKAQLAESEGFQPLVLTIPTAECELAVRNEFLKNPKHKYLRWRCGNYNGNWIPLKRE